MPMEVGGKPQAVCLRRSYSDMWVKSYQIYVNTTSRTVKTVLEDDVATSQ